jgi:hypothetical protein
MEKKNKNKTGREKPFTPEPPQVMDPSKNPKNRNTQSEKEPDTYDKVKKEREAKPKLLGESETEITDETTI